MNRTTIEKLTSRKFWVCVAAFLGSIGTSIAGLATNNEIIAGIGVVCSILSAAVYAFCESWVDAANVSSTTKQTINTIHTEKEGK